MDKNFMFAEEKFLSVEVPFTYVFKYGYPKRMRQKFQFLHLDGFGGINFGKKFKRKTN